LLPPGLPPGEVLLYCQVMQEYTTLLSGRQSRCCANLAGGMPLLAQFDLQPALAYTVLVGALTGDAGVWGGGKAIPHADP